jgi:predicted enzyme related to lactoylglutathione lyase
VSEREGFARGVPCWIDTWQPDAEAALRFYTALFGWQAEDTMPPDTPGRHFMCRLRGRDVAAIASRPESAPPVPAWNTYVWVESAQDTAARASEAGGSVVMDPFDALDGGRIAVVADPAGAVFCIWQPGAHRGAQLVNEPGAWAMSALTTPDPDGAKRFYGEVFGWEADTFDLGGAEATLWRVPGYVGGEPQQPVPRDVVGTMFPMATGASETPPSWTVDFWVANLDEVIATASDLGATVISGPYDIPGAGMRQAAIADPQGAPLSLTQPPGLA